MSQNIMTLYPYLKNFGKGYSAWVFDDERMKLKEEAFVCGMSEIMSATVAKKGIRKAGKGFKMSFSDQPFGHDVELTWLKQGDLVFQWADQEWKIAGNWYSTGNTFKKGPKVGWLCPALLKYFSEAPLKLYVKAEPLPSDVDPIWHKPQEETAFVTTEMQAA